MEYGAFAGVYDAFMKDVDYGAWLEYLLPFLPPAPARVADCACGTGALTLGLARAGYRVTGLDASDAMLMEAAQKARRAGLKIPFVCQDMRALSLHSCVDAVTAACDGVNYLLSAEDAERFFRSAAAALRKGGVLLFDISSEYKLESLLGVNTFAEEEPGAAYIWKNNYDPASRLIEMQLTLFKKQGGAYTRAFERHVQRAHRAEELKEALSLSGFDISGIYGFGTMEPPGRDTERIQFIAVKK